MLDHLPGELFEERVLKRLDRQRPLGGSWGIIRPWFLRLDNIAIFSSGRGDCLYPCWFGLDESGAVVDLVTDFKIANPPDSEMLRLQVEYRRSTMQA